MRCPACNHENRDGAKFCEECAAPFSRTCRACGATLSARAKFCSECAAPVDAAARHDPIAETPKHLAEKILSGRAALTGERKRVTVLFADVKGSMDLAEQVDPERWHQIVDRFFQIMTAGVHRFEGTINQYIGDGVMALFGAPIAHEDHAQRACYAALHLRDELRRYGDELRADGLGFAVRVGLNSGEVVVGAIGDDLRMEYTAQGHTVGLAARMEQLAEAGRILVSAHTAKLVTGYFTVRDLGPTQVKGVREAMHVYELESAGTSRTRLDVARVRGLSRLVGRARDVATVELALERALEGHGQVVGVVGEAGVGKSRLCLDFVERCRARGVQILEAHCPAHGATVPHLALLELLRGYFGLTERDSGELAREKVATAVAQLNPGLRDVLPLVFDFLGVPDPAAPLPRVDPEERHRQLFRFVRRLVQSRPEEPGVILVDDLHWIDAGSDAFLAQVVEAIPPTRTLLLVNFRPEYHATWMGKSYYQQVALQPLGFAASAELVHELLGYDPSLDGIPQRIQTRTAGNPFFIEEVVHALVEDGSLAGARGSYRLVATRSDVAIPDTVQAVLAARMDRLPEREKSVLQTAAVIGREFTESMLRRIVATIDRRGDDVTRALAALVTSDFVYEAAVYPDSSYAFKHPLTQEVAYGAQLSDRRARVHAAVADALSELHAEKPAESAALVAHHWERAGDMLRAAKWHHRAGIWSGTSNPGDAVTHWERGYELARRAPESPEALALRLELCTQLINGTVRRGGDPAHITALFAEGRELGGRIGDKVALCALHLAYADSSFNAATEEDPVQAHRLAARLADEIDDRTLRACAWSFLSYVLTVVAGDGDRAESDRLLAATMELIGGDVALGVDSVGFSVYVWCTYYIASQRALEGAVTVVEGRAALEAAAALAVREHELETLGWVYLSLAFVAFYAGDAAGTTKYAALSMEVAETIGNFYTRVWGFVSTGRAHLLAERWDEAATAFTAARDLARARRVTLYGEGIMLAGLAEAELGRGNLAAARRAAEESVAVSTRWKRVHVDAQLTLARVLLRIDGLAASDRVARHLDAATACIETSGTRIIMPLVEVERAELARLRGDEPARRRALENAHRLWTRFGTTNRAAEVAAQLKSLS